MAGFISEADAAALVAARHVLRKLQATAQDQSHREATPRGVFALGRFATACDMAETALFEALSHADAFLDDAVAREALHR